MESIWSQLFIDEKVIGLRMIMSLVLGGLIGLERESRRQQAGFRTHILICLGSTLLMILSIYIPQTFKDFQNGDPGRIAAQVITGIGFLGGGAIFRLGANVKGLTTAATIWAVAAVGLVVGAGLYAGGLIATALILFVLIILGKVEKRFFPQTHIDILKLYFKASENKSDQVFEIVKKYQIEIHTMNINQLIENQKTLIKLIIQIPVKFNYADFYKELNTIEGLTDIELEHDS